MIGFELSNHTKKDEAIVLLARRRSRLHWIYRLNPLCAIKSVRKLAPRNNIRALRTLHRTGILKADWDSASTSAASFRRDTAAAAQPFASTWPPCRRRSCGRQSGLHSDLPARDPIRLARPACVSYSSTTTPIGFSLTILHHLIPSSIAPSIRRYFFVSPPANVTAGFIRQIGWIQRVDQPTCT